METDYDIVVVGAGMIGSAAAKYISIENGGLKVGLIGPSEPKRREDATIHGAHYDEGRICRSVEIDMIWGTAAKRSLARFNDIEKQTGLPIFSEVGYLHVATTGSERSVRLKRNIEIIGQVCEPVYLDDSRVLHQAFPYMNFGDNVESVFLPKKCGSVNPRNLVKAQKCLANKAGCHYIDDVVDSVQRTASGIYVMKLAKGGEVTSQKVLLATGSFAECRDLLPDGVQPDMTWKPNTVEVNEAERQSLSGMPCICYKAGPWDAPDINFVAYIMPPIQYPDGKFYLKVGHGNMVRPLTTPEEMRDWYQRGNDPDVNAFLKDLTRSLFPNISMERYKFNHCVTTGTPKGYPYIDLVQPGLGVAMAGCGQAAKSSDELGRIAARMMVKGRWDHDMPEGAFKFKGKWKNRATSTLSRL